ncbi:PAS domain S-box protein [Alkalinema pantanalense CENA528]|uniref:PAS domain S-box protein n=1 Tax=Alkalinema pantanalense TaxID=1620705 RepID=UPI003D6EF671
MDLIIEIAGYLLGEVLYESAHTLVYRAIRRDDHQPVIIKFLRTSYPTVLELIRFQNQFHCAQSIQSSLIVQPYALEPWQNGFALIMEDFGGISLRDYLDRAQSTNSALASSPAFPHASIALPLAEFFSIACQLVEILELLGQHHLIHKDIKPSNLLINPDTQLVKLTDFSLASLLPKESPTLLPLQRLEGTLAYLSPEQTGRMNRGIDYRSDFYAMGITWFELLTGRLPFHGEDALEWVHCHIAQQPPLAHEYNPIVPPMLAEIINKLMAKDPNDRYQSVLGLRHDLEFCQQAWQTQGEVPNFPLARQDRSDRFHLSDKLYGRDTEVAELLSAFDRISGTSSLTEASQANSQSVNSQSDRCELILVTGCSGVGKTAVVNEVHRSIVRRCSYFIQGKFEQAQRDCPFSAFVQALQDLIQQLLCESEQQLHYWRSQLLAALGQNGQVILEVVPNLEQIIGPQPSVVELSGSALQNRFYRVFQKFIQVFANKIHPLVIFLDDLQWADRASLQMMQHLMESQQALLFIGAYRENEVLPNHPLMLTLEKLYQTGVRVQTLSLKPLTPSDLRCLIPDIFKGCSDHLVALTPLLYQQTQGNPLFAKQFLSALHQDGLITFNHGREEWQCDVAQISEWTLADDVVQLMIGQIHKLPQPTQEHLQLAACLGNQFNLETLSLLFNQSHTETARHLWAALQVGLITATGDIYQLYHSNSEDRLIVLPQTQDSKPGLSVHLAYRFVHDRIQQAAYELISITEQATIHRYIGCLLLQKLSPAEQTERLFEIVQHLNIGITAAAETLPDLALASINLPSVDLAEIQPIALARLNWQAGHKAQATTAYATAIEYFTQGIQLLPVGAWQQHYDLTLALHSDRVEAAYLNTEYEFVEPWSETVLQQAQDVLDTIAVQEIRLVTARAQGQLQQALNTGLHILQSLNITFPEQPNSMDVIMEGRRIRQLWIYRLCLDQESDITGSPTDQQTDSEPSPLGLLDLPPMTNPNDLAAMQILTNLSGSAAVIAPTLLALLIFKQIELSLLGGNCIISGISYGDYGILLCGILEDPNVGYEFGQLALQLLERLQARPWTSRALFITSTFIQHWKKPLAQGLPGFLEGYHWGLATGDWECMALNAVMYCEHRYFCGHELVQLADEMEQYGQMLAQVKQITALQCHRINQQLVLTLLGRRGTAQSAEGGLNSDFYNLQGEACYADRFFLPNTDFSVLPILCFHQCFLYYLFGHFTLANQQLSLLDLDEGSGDETKLQIMLNGLRYRFPFYHALILLACCRGAASHQIALYLEQVRVHQQKLQRWANLVPENHQHRWELVEAERQAILGNPLAAMEFYDRAIANAKKHRFIQDEALANERAAEFYLSWDKPKIAQVYLTDAYYAYARWGAKAKTDDLQQRYGNLLLPPLRPAEFSSPSTDQSPNTAHHFQTSLRLGQVLDFSSIVKASQILAGEVVLDQLLTKLMQVVLENAGATRGVVILQEDHDWTIAAIASHLETQIILPPQVPLKSHSDVPLPLIHYVINCQEPIVLDEVRLTSWFVTHPYWQTHPVCSVLAMPILGQGKLMGVLYLENEVTPAAFSHGQVDLLKILCTQAAIALENSRLYQQLEAYSQNLEQRVQERTEALRQSEHRYATLTEYAPVGIFRTDAAGNSLYHNPKWLEMAGLLLENPPSNNWEQAIYSLDRDRVIQEWQTAVQNQQPFTSEYGLQKPDGTVTWVMGQAVPERDDQGHILGYVGTVTDISGRKASERRYAALTEAVPVGLFRFDHTGQCVYVNKRWCELTQQPPETAMGYGWVQTIHPDDREWALQAWQQAYAEQGGYYQGEGRYLLPDGQISWFYCQITPEMDTTGNTIGYLGAITDITALKETEANLKRAETEAKIREQQVISLLNNIPHIAWLKDTESRFLAVNQPFAQACGYTPEQLVGMQDQDIWLLDLAAEYVREDRNVMQSRQQKRVEERLITFDGQEQWLETIKTPIVTDRGEILGTAGIAMDITHRKQTEQALAELNQELEQRVQQRTEELQQQTQLLQTILNSMGDGVVVANCTGEIILHNPAVEQITGLPGLHSQAQDWQSLWGIYLPNGSPCPVSHIPLVQAIQGYATDQVEVVLRNAMRPEGVHVEVTARPLTDATGSGIGGVAVFRDVTVRKQMEEVLRQSNLELERRVEDRTAELRQAMESAEAANRTKSAFLANMSHELRTPLNAILGFSQLLAHDPNLNSTHQEQLSIINSSGEHLLGLINDILEMSKIEAGRSTFHPNPFDLRAFLEGLIQMFQLKAEQKGLKLSWERTEVLPQYIQTDENKLRQVLINLLSNAIKFTDRGSVKLRVSCHDVTAPNWAIPTTFNGINLDQAAYVICEVEDTGMGIAPEEIHLLFEPFIQSSTQPRLQEGTGLGLPISREFVRLMGGELTVSSQVGQGSCFRFHIPIERVTSDLIPCTHFPQRPIGLAPGQPTYRILVVEDHLANRKLMLLLLQSLGFHVREATNGQEAVELWETWQPHLIWMDMRMPIMNGYEATQQIRQREQSHRNLLTTAIEDPQQTTATTTSPARPSTPTKIIALTAGAFAEERTKTLAMGCDDFVTKPLQDRIILDKLVEHLGVRYLFAAPPSSQSSNSAEAVPSIEVALTELQAMPIDWVDQLQQATIEVNVEKILSLLPLIPEEQSDLRLLITHKIHSFDFEQILDLIAEAYHRLIP